jgi:hypothetical protein
MKRAVLVFAVSLLLIVSLPLFSHAGKGGHRGGRYHEDIGTGTGTALAFTWDRCSTAPGIILRLSTTDRSMLRHRSSMPLRLLLRHTRIRTLPLPISIEVRRALTQPPMQWNGSPCPVNGWTAHGWTNTGCRCQRHSKRTVCPFLRPHPGAILKPRSNGGRPSFFDAFPFIFRA